jgi:hypothetical protein
MKGALLALLVVAVALTLPVTASAQDWVLDWHSTGTTLFDTWNLSGSSAATLTPSPNAPIYHPDGPAYELRYTYQGRQYGGFVAQGRFQEQIPGMTVPAAGAPITNNTFGEGQFASGDFNLTGNSFTATRTPTGRRPAGWPPLPPPPSLRACCWAPSAWRVPSCCAGSASPRRRSVSAGRDRRTLRGSPGAGCHPSPAC